MRDLFAKKASKPRYVVRCMTKTGRVHLYVAHPRHRADKKTWTNSFLKAHVFVSFEKAELEARILMLSHFQIVPVGYEGPPYWESKAHVRHQGSMARYHNPRVFLTGPDGKRIEV